MVKPENPESIGLSESDLDFDRAHLWHPYTSALHPLPSYPVARAQGCEIELSNGQRLVDGMASWWSVVHGYNHPHLNAAIGRQLEDMSHVMFGGLTHGPAVRLGKQLIDLTPDSLQTVFLADSGSIAVEVALKQALQYWQGRGVRGRHRFAALRFGYHGDTFGAMSVTDPENGMHRLFAGFLPQNIFLREPPSGFRSALDPEVVSEWRSVLAQHRHELAAVIIEPVVQGAGGMRIYSPAYVRALREICDELDLLLIFDEIATGFGRTGEWFALIHAGVCPDILCLGKALTGGYMTLAATLCSQQVAETVCRSEAGVFMHGPTFMANPLACAVAGASIELLQDESWRARVQHLSQQLELGLSPLLDCPGVADVRVLGAIGVVEMEAPVPVAEAQRVWVERGVWIRPFGRLIYVMPPFLIDDARLGRLIDGICFWCEQGS